MNACKRRLGKAVLPRPRPPGQLLACQIGHGYEKVRSRTLFHDFIDATAHVVIHDDAISVSFQKRARKPLLLSAGFDRKIFRVPWLGRHPIQLNLG